LEICRKLAQENPAAYLHVPNILNNLANLQADNNQFALARINYQEALDIYRKLAQENPAAYLPDVANTLNNLGILQATNQEFIVARTNYQEALDIYRKLAQENPAAYLPDMAMTLNSLANLQYTNKEFDLARANYQEALEICRKLAQENPAAYLPNLAMMLQNLAALQAANKEFDLACANYQEALDIYRKLAQENPAVFDLDYCNPALNICSLYKKYVVQGNLQYIGLANNLLADVAQRLGKYPTIPQAQDYISEQLMPLQHFFKQSNGYIYDVPPKKKHLPSLKELVSVYKIFQQAKETTDHKAAIALYDKCITAWEKMVWENNEDKDNYAEAHLRRGMLWSLSNKDVSNLALQDFEKAAALCVVQLEDDTIWALLLETTYQHCKEIDKTIAKGFMSSFLGKKEKQQIQNLKKTTFDLLAGKELNEDAQRWKEKLEKEFY
jgi:hypothetical protein